MMPDRIFQKIAISKFVLWGGGGWNQNSFKLILFFRLETLATFSTSAATRI